MRAFDEQRFVFVTGKGGVGKTTVAASLSLALAERGKRVLVAMCNAKERMSAMFGTAPIGPEIMPIAPRLWAVNIEPDLAFAEYGEIVLKIPALYRLVFQNRYVKSFLPAVPGLAEWAVLGKAWYHTTEALANGDRRFDVVVLDAPATGHGLDMLRVPKVIVEVVPPGVLRRDAERAWTLFQNPKLTSVLVVTIPEELPTSETLELIDTVRNELNMPIGGLVVNGLVRRLFSLEERERLLAVAGLAEAPSAAGSAGAAVTGSSGLGGAVVRSNLDGSGAAVLGAAIRRAQRERLQEESLERLKAAGDLRRFELPYLLEDAARPAAIRQFAAHF